MATNTLKIVATPIGNLRDISLRAIEAIKEADTIFAEDTRTSLKLISALNIALKAKCKMISCDARKEKTRIALASTKLAANEKVIYMSDAGCPGISDPGSLLVQGVLALGFAVEVIPGPSAHSTALMGAGLDCTRFAFLGFLPKKKSERKLLITNAYKCGLALLIYESPLRTKDTLAELYELLGPARVVVARELTKFYESFHRGQLGSDLSPALVEKGECVIIIEAPNQKALAGTAATPNEDDLKSFILKQQQKGLSRRDIASLAQQHFGIKKKIIFAIMHN